MNHKPSIGIIGTWHLGCVYGACFAKNNYSVTCFDENKEIIDDLKNGSPPIFEPGLPEIINQYNGKNLNYTNNVRTATEGKDFVFITIDIPVDDKDRINLKSFKHCEIFLQKYISPNTIVIIASQIPIGTCRKLSKKLKKIKNVSVVYMPENLRLGTAIQEFLNPDRIILGSESKNFSKVFKKYFPFLKTQILDMNWESAEMSKHALNTYLSTIISLSSELGDLCEKTGADMENVVAAIKSDRRVSLQAPISAGLGFAGGTLGRDLNILKTISRRIGYSPNLISAVMKVNCSRLPHLIERIEDVLSPLHGKTIGLLGLTYKPGTSTLKRSQSIELSKLLKTKGVIVKVFDPKIKTIASANTSFLLVHSIEELAQDTNAIILMTPWPEFAALDPKSIKPLLKNKILIDTKNFLNEKKYLDEGFIYIKMGRS